MDKTKLIPALIISIAILVLLIIRILTKETKQIHPKANHTLRHWKARM